MDSQNESRLKLTHWASFTVATIYCGFTLWISLQHGWLLTPSWIILLPWNVVSFCFGMRMRYEMRVVLPILTWLHKAMKLIVWCIAGWAVALGFWQLQGEPRGLAWLVLWVWGYLTLVYVLPAAVLLRVLSTGFLRLANAHEPPADPPHTEIT